MSVYIDDHRAPYGRMRLSHMIADTDGELEDMARQLKLKKEWKHVDHYDVCENKRRLAIALGAKATTQRDLAAIRRKNRGRRA